ncbi:MAG: hypothetical protein U5N26_02200 [Candidatus Marinimicrobia bacterium]|nr:hypothetical protein [Candidatus Neomarinimicrobiota bacterium]
MGNPSLSRIEKLQVGVVNADNFRDYTGEIWVNEMRVVESDNDPGTAMRGAFDLNFGGFFDFNANARKTDADFRQVNQQRSNNQTTSESVNMTMTVHAEKLLPEKWNLKIPVNISRSRDQSVPKYYPGSDILLEEDPPDSVRSISEKRSVSTSLRRSSGQDDPFLARVLVNPVQASFNISENRNSSLEIRNKVDRSVSGKFSYQLNIDKGKGIPLSFLDPLS